jgi:hypothetical protein
LTNRSLRRASKPSLGDHLVEVLDSNAVKPREDRRVAIEVRGREENAW